MSSVLDDDIEEGWCIDTDGLNFGISRNEKYFSCHLKSKETTEEVSERDSLYPLRNSFRHSYVNTNSNEDELENEIIKSAGHSIEKNFNQEEYQISLSVNSNKRRVCKRNNPTSQYLKKHVRIGLVTMASYMILH